MEDKKNVKSVKLDDEMMEKVSGGTDNYTESDFFVDRDFDKELFEREGGSLLTADESNRIYK